MQHEVLIFNWMDIKNPKAGGQERYCFEIAKRLARDGFSVTWITSKFKGGSETETFDGINVVRVGNIFSVYVISFLEYLKRRKADFVFISINAIPFLAPLHKRKRIIMLHHRIDLSVMKAKIGPLGAVSLFLQEYVNPIIYRKDIIITSSESSKADFQSIGYGNMDVVRLGLDLPKTEDFHKDDLIVSPGPIRPWKHHDMVIRAFLGVDSAWKLTIFGAFESDDYERYLRNLVKDLGVSERVSFPGRLSDDAVKEVYKKSKICVLGTEKEGWGFVAMEAQSFGCPVVAFNVPGIKDSVIDGKTGLLVQFGDVPAMRDTLKRLTTDENLFSDLSSAAIKRSNEYDWETCYDDFKNELYKLQISVPRRLRGFEGQTELKN